MGAAGTRHSLRPLLIFEGRLTHRSGAKRAAGMRPRVFALFERLNQDRNVFSLVSLPGLTRQSIPLEKALF